MNNDELIEISKLDDVIINCPIHQLSASGVCSSHDCNSQTLFCMKVHKRQLSLYNY